MLRFLVTSWLHLASCFVEKHASLNALHPSTDGIHIISNPISVVMLGPNYNINVQSQDPYDIKVSLNKTWGFESTSISTITFTFYGFTYFPDADNDILIVFSVADIQYFSFFLHLDNKRIKSRIYPSISIHNIEQKVSDWLSNTTHTRWDRISNNNQWKTIDSWNKQSLWPLRFVITNDPKHKHCFFTFYHDSIASLAVNYSFNTLFATNQNMDVYIMGDSFNEQFAISSVNVMLTHQPITNPPTPEPTLVPTPTLESELKSTNQTTPMTTNQTPHYSLITSTYIPTLIPTKHATRTHRPTWKTRMADTKSKSVIVDLDSNKFQDIKLSNTKANPLTNIANQTNEKGEMYGNKTSKYVFVFFGVLLCAFLMLFVCMLWPFKECTIAKHRSPSVMNVNMVLDEHMDLIAIDRTRDQSVTIMEPTPSNISIEEMCNMTSNDDTNGIPEFTPIIYPYDGCDENESVHCEVMVKSLVSEIDYTESISSESSYARKGAIQSVSSYFGASNSTRIIDAHDSYSYSSEPKPLNPFIVEYESNEANSTSDAVLL